MRIHWMILPGVAASVAMGQTVTSVYNRDNHEPFQLKNVKVESTVIGPVVRTDTLLTYKNPYGNLTEATLNFELSPTGALGGFAYFYGQEYVAGRLMDKAKAWEIYTAITSRNRDPGIMEQWSPRDYHCQIYPIRRGQDLKVRIWSVGMLEPGSTDLEVPKPKVPRAVSGYSVLDSSLVEPEWAVRAVKSAPVTRGATGFQVPMTNAVEAIAERFKDGRFYVAGLVRTSKLATGKISVLRASYEIKGRPDFSRDVTAKVAELVRNGTYLIAAENSNFGDPFPNQGKALRVTFKVDGVVHGVVAPEHTSVNFLVNRPPSQIPKIAGLKQSKFVSMDGSLVAFAGWARSCRTLAVVSGSSKIAFHPVRAANGSDTARIWAQQMLANSAWTQARALRFSMKYGVPSNATALLAVPKDEWKAYNKRLAEMRRASRENARQGRNWTGQRNQNWNATGGGDPEIRVEIPGAKHVEAILPDRRVIELTRMDNAWGGNFEVPADAPEGSYTVQIEATMADGTVKHTSWTYQVDRTPPQGTAKLFTENGTMILEVCSEPHLAQVEAFDESGQKWTLTETQDGVYRVALPRFVKLIVVMKDRAGNKADIKVSGMGEFSSGQAPAGG